jgi:hypothetical protein
MTNEEILEAEKLIAGMRNDLSLIAGTTDADKLAARLPLRLHLCYARRCR